MVPPAGTGSGANVGAATRPRKPPACDRCKAKRVLCHPHPNGCPRCNEKGIQCTTTPVVRRKRKRSEEARGESEARETPVPPAVARPAADEPALALPDPPTPFGLASNRVSVEAGASAVPTPPPARLPYAYPQVPSLDSGLERYQREQAQRRLTWSGPSFRGDASTSQSPAPSAGFDPALQALVPASNETVLTPEMSMQLYEAFRQSSHFDQPLMPFTSLASSLSSNGWFVDLLPSTTRALALAAFAIGALYSYDAAIIGPTSMRAFTDVQWQGQDLRPYGWRRRGKCEKLREAAVRAARDSDVILLPTVDNAATCYLLDALHQLGGEAQSRMLGTRPYYRAYVSHLTTLVATGNAPVSDRLGAGIWAIHLTADMCTELPSGRLTLTEEEQKLMFGRDGLPDASSVRAQHHHLLANSRLEDWPSASPLCLLFVRTARFLVSEMLAPHLRNRLIDVNVLARAVQAVTDLREVSLLHGKLWDRQLAFIAATVPAAATGKSCPASARPTGAEPPPLLFQHATGRRIRWNRLLGAKGVRNFGVYLWISAVVPLVRELERRARQVENPPSAMAATQTQTQAGGAAASAAGAGPPTDGASASHGESDFARSYRREQLALLVRQAKSLVPRAVECLVELVRVSPGLALFAQTRAIGIVEVVELFVELVENGDVPLDRATRELAKEAAQILKIGGWVHASHEADALVRACEELGGSTGGEAGTGANGSHGETGGITSASSCAGPSPDEAVASLAETTDASASFAAAGLNLFPSATASEPFLASGPPAASSLMTSWLPAADEEGGQAAIAELFADLTNGVDSVDGFFG